MKSGGRDAGAYFGVSFRRYVSGEMKRSGRTRRYRPHLAERGRECAPSKIAGPAPSQLRPRERGAQRRQSGQGRGRPQARGALQRLWRGTPPSGANRHLSGASGWHRFVPAGATATSRSASPSNNGAPDPAYHVAPFAPVSADLGNLAGQFRPAHPPHFGCLRANRHRKIAAGLLTRGGGLDPSCPTAWCSWR